MTEKSAFATGNTAGDTYGDKPDLLWVHKYNLIVDKRYQRSIESDKSQRLIANIAANFVWRKCAPIQVADNGDDTYCIIDGQHRWAASMKIAVTHLPVWNMGELTLAEQAAMIVAINSDRINMTPMAVYLAKVKAGDPQSVKIDRVIKAAGCQLAPNFQPMNQLKQGQMLCLGTLRRAVKLYKEEYVVQVLRLVRDAWADQGGIRTEILSAAVEIAIQPDGFDALKACFTVWKPDQLIAKAYNMRTMDQLHSLSWHVKAAILSSGAPRRMAKRVA